MAIVQAGETTGGVRRLRVANPATKEHIGDISVNTLEIVRETVARSRTAQEAWGAKTVDERAIVIDRALKLLIARQEDFISVIMRETGRSHFETIMMEIMPACDALSYFSKQARRTLRDRKVGLHLLRNKRLTITYQPLGVVGVITPWNGPFILSINPAIQALLAGNGVVIKPSEVTPFSGKLVAELFRDAGLPSGLLAVLEGDGETGVALIESGVDKISFTGSVKTGRKVGEACGRNLVPCTLELGGKDAMIVCDDADVVRAANGAVFGALMNAGQFCCSIERIYVAENIADEFIRRVVAKVKTLKQATSGEFDLGPMIWPPQLDVIERHIEDAKKHGATVLVGGKRNEQVGGLYYEPTVITNVTHDMAIMREETFGPVVAIVRVQSDDEAIRCANDSTYGLTATVWSRSDERAEAIAKRLVVGSISVNDVALTYGALEAPFGGRRSSGVGQIHGENSLRNFCYPTPILFDRFRTKEEVVWYPYTNDKAKLLQRIIRWIWGTPLGKLMS